MAKAIAALDRSSKRLRRHEDELSVTQSQSPDLSAVMTHFNEGLSLLIVCQRSLAAFEDAVHEQQVIREAIAKFMAVYEEIDAADQLIRESIGG